MKLTRLIFFCITFLLMLAFLSYWQMTSWAFDVSMYMVAAQQILAGAKPYVDVVDINPPLILYIHVLVVWVANFLSCPPLELYNFTLMALSIVFALFINQKLQFLGNAARYAALGFIAASFHALIAFQYGQREHLYITFMLPYFCVRWVDAPKSISMYILAPITGLLACLKPGFFAMLVSYELFLYLYRGRRELRHWILLIAPACIYLLHFAFLPENISHAFWGELVPLVLTRYGTMGLSAREMLEFWGFTLLSYGILALLSIQVGLRSQDKKFKILLPIGICSMVGLVSAIWQGKGWEYHLIPAQFFLFFGCPILFVALRQWLPTTIKQIFAGVLLVFLLLQHFYVLTGKIEFTRNRFIETCGNEDLKALAPRGSRILIFSVHPCFSYPLFYQQGYVPGTRYVSLFPIAFFNYSPERVQMLKSRYPLEKDLFPEEKKFVENVKFDLKTNKPDFIIFPNELVPEGFNPYHYAVSTGIFKEVETNYRLLQNTDRWRVYQLL